MSAPAVKPALPTSGAQAPKVGSGAPVSATVNNPPTSATGGPKIQPIITNSPVKPTGPANANHAVVPAIPLSMVQDHKAPVNIFSQPPLPIPRTPEKIKEHPLPVPPVAIKPTSNGVEGTPTKSPVISLPSADIKKSDEGSSSGAVLNHTTETAAVTPTPVQQPVVVPVPVTPASTLSPVVAQQSPAKQEVPPKAAAAAATTNHTAPPIIIGKPEVPSSGIEGKKLADAEPVPIPPVVSTPAVAPPPPPTPIVAQTPTPEPPPKIIAVIPSDVTVSKTRIEISKPEFKVATPPRNSKRKREIKLVPEVKTPISDLHDDRKSKRVRTRTQPYQSPLPELTYIAKLKTLMKSPDDKLIVFYNSVFIQ